MLNFDLRDGNVAHVLDVDTLAVTEELDGYAEISRLSEPDTSATIRIGYIDVQGDFEVRAAEARYPDQTLRSVSASELSLGLTAAEARGLAYRWLVEQRIGRDTLRLALPPSSISVGVGDIVQILGARWRVDLVESGETIQLDVVRVEGGPYEPIDMDDEIFGIRNFVAPVPTFPVFLDLPLVTGEEIPHSPHLAIAAEPWPGLVGLWSSAGESGFELNRVIDSPSIIGKTESSLDAAAIGVWDRGQALRMKLVGGALTSAEVLSVLNGTNAMAIGDGLGGDWEVFQFASAELVAPDTFEVSMRLRGQLGTDGVMPPSWPIGSTVVLLDRSVQQIELASSARGLVRQYRIGVASRGYDDPTAVSIVKAFDGVGLRPYPICHLRSTGSVGSEVEITWIRRTRIEGDNWQQSEVPLGEENEAYVVRILSGGAIIATYEVGATSFHYPPSAQANDGISGPFAVSVAQVSSRFGPGPFRVIAVAS
jgi:hypothetical protein